MARDPASARNRREEVLRAAAAVFSDKGYRSSTIQDVAAILGFTSAALYYYFESKQEMLSEIIVRPIGQLIEMAEEIEASDLSAPEKLHAIAGRHIGMMLSQRAFFTVAQREWMELSAAEARRLAGLEAAYRIRIRDILAAGREQGDVRDLNTDVAAHMLVGLMNSVLGWHRDSMRLSFEQIAATVIDIFHRGIVARP